MIIDFSEQPNTQLVATTGAEVLNIFAPDEQWGAIAGGPSRTEHETRTGIDGRAVRDQHSVSGSVEINVSK